MSIGAAPMGKSSGLLDPEAQLQPQAAFVGMPQRVVSLVPSLTESLFDLGFGNTVAGITDYCIHPAGKLDGLPRLGGPKNPRTDEIIALQPDLILANQEENTPHTVAALEKAGLRVWVSFPQTVRQAVQVLWDVLGIFQDSGDDAPLRLKSLEAAVEMCAAASQDASRVRYFCPIWQDQLTDGTPWWMTFNNRTYAHSVLELMGGENVFADRVRRFPLAADLGQAPADPAAAEGRDTRYPRLSVDEILAADPQLVLLPSEPFEFDKSHVRQLTDSLAETSAVRQGRLLLVDGSLITWHGTRLGRALQDLPGLFAG
jgi:iron complex transport system substrate-binding protein